MSELSRKIFGIPRAWIVVSSGALFYCYQFILRVAPNVMKEDWCEFFSLDASDFGQLVSLYSWSYAAVQIPLGVMLDRFGAGRIIVIASTICALSCFLFAFSSSIYVAGIGMFFMGLGSAAGFLGSIKLGTTWFPPSQLAKVVALTLLFGTIGASFGGTPLSAAADHYGWQYAIKFLGVIGLIISLIIFMAVGRHGEPHTYEPADSLLHGLIKVIRKPQAWLIATYGMLMYAPVTIMGTAWGVPFVKSVYNIQETVAATLTTALFIGAAVGSPVFALYSDKIKRRHPPMMVGIILSLIVNALVVFVPNIPLIPMYMLFFAIGFCYTAKSLSFTSICEIMPKSCSGVAVGFLNTITMATGALFHPLVGNLLDYHWNGTVINDVNIYSEWDYRFALSIVPICMLFGIIVVRFIKETHHAQKLTPAEESTAQLGALD
ncbi:MFS transporter [Candidatus Odyssella thessalonicensis]|uniref:MFS transporter n=1 Tax=Candidatus Odyssella thessalonicensis TaxID=84647 RepID=UPI000225A8EE|nr:MFS transporter [Candidatus Odyssella thessalonicensis]